MDKKNVLFNSAEIRWFLPPTEDWGAVLEWFLDKGTEKANQTMNSSAEVLHLFDNIKKEDLRTDEYLIIPQCTTVGVKQRQGKLEVKAQVGEKENYQNEHLSGIIDYWSKWSLQPSQTNLSLLEKDLQHSGEWLKINKIRYLLKLSHSENGIKVLPPDAWPEKGCQVELTQVWADGSDEKWTSFGFEAFGGSFQNLGHTLKDSILFFISKKNQPTFLFSTQNSLSYPAWLQFFQKNNF
ncbi:hypothetical protein SAMN00777080_3024 [Aquiflexum balticum DSM 16537]|uniref:Uncharacterized protein n=1 Tax=Aquiflexum balticum DSM 16537 TaxID=758820 RepID=A0A1W2H671_9BACT|nr:hypothetical protein [Aquiflexum balticum]SMD44403.1 hypothetical protein SAMN00777080_3024 [Aquiflexum balticum DSM 16537]